MVVDGEAAVQALLDLDPRPGVALPLPIRLNLEAVLAQADGVVVGHCPLIFEAADGIQVQACGQGTIGGPRIQGRYAKLSVETGEVGLQHLVRLLEGRGPASRNSMTRRSCSVPQSRSIRPLA